MTFADNFKRLMERTKNGMGQWVVIRHYTDIHSVYWNEEKQEAVGGAPFEFEDTVVLTMKQTAFTPARPAPRVGVVHLESVETSMSTYRYFFAPGVTIKEDDEIFDLDGFSQTPPTPDYTASGTGARIASRYKVKFIHDYRQGNRGDIGYILAIAERSYI